MKDLVIFLDIDGVMNNTKTPIKKFLPEAVDIINKLGNEYNAKIVISSSWRLFMNFHDLKDFFESNGVKTEIVDKTPVFTGNYSVSTLNCCEKDFYEKMGEEEGRNKEILDYIRLMHVNNYIIFDDMPFSNKELKKHFIKTNLETGLNWSYWDGIQNILK